MMTKSQEALKADIEKIDDISMIEDIRIFIIGMLEQQKIFERQHRTSVPHV